MCGAEIELVPYGASWRSVVGTQEASAPASAWRTNSFDDAGWPVGIAPIGRPSDCLLYTSDAADE